MCERIDSIFQEIFPSPEMASYLAGCDLIREDIRDAFAYAPIPLSRKRDLFLRLASGNDNSYFHRQATCIERTIREMQPKPGDVLPNHRSTGLSPLYRLAAFRGRLPEEERLLEKVSQYVNGEEERGSALWNYMFGLYDGRMKRTVTEDQILSYIRSNANT